MLQLIPTVLSTLASNPIALIGAASPFLLGRINEKNATIKKDEANREAGIKEASRITNEITTGADRLLYFGKESMWGIVERNMHALDAKAVSETNEGPAKNNVSEENLIDRKNWDSYQDELVKWCSQKTTRQAQMRVIFGGEKTLDQFNTVLDMFEELMNMLNAGYFERTESKYRIDKPGDYLDVHQKLEKELSLFSGTLIERIGAM